MEALFWISLAGILYPYLGYPVALWVLGRLFPRPTATAVADLPPTLTIIVPVYNEAARMPRKLDNTLALEYPAERRQIVFVSDGSTDESVELLRARTPPGVDVIALPERRGKAAAVNTALAHATGEIVVFTDASIQLEPDSLRAIVAPFADPLVGCVSGEDHIREAGGEALYGRYELTIRRLESRLHSIAGASGSFYAQRRQLCAPFIEGLAPDFLSVLRTVAQGHRAVSERRAIGYMTATRSARHEFERKVRTLIRGMAALFAHPALLNPWSSGWYAFILLSHKIGRWMVPFFLVGALVSAGALAFQPFYALALLGQIAFYAVAAAALCRWGGAEQSLPGRIALYFASVNMAILAAWVQYLRGVRQELWTPTRR